ncbi:sirohydrochlorin chelatase [Geminocystis sp. CENA526]|uniref:sirohydrochlorin chelatase n=1 Tax=Geminocystis sp. CENA526 TaxID=1355871 RepID=UPI003D6E1B8C
MSNSAYLLVVHGSRNPSYRQQLDELQNLVIQGLNESCLLTTAYLELDDRALSVKIVEFALECVTYGYKTLKIFPLFLFSGTHVLEDIPREVSIAQQNCPITLEVMPILGKSPDLIPMLESQYQQYQDFDRAAPLCQRILFCHGTKLEQGYQESRIMAEKLRANVAYWAISPDLSTVMENMINDGSQNIVILPYFLFSGKIIDSIEQEIKLLQTKPQTNLTLLSPLASSIELAQVIIRHLQK